jgi:ketosteroid isomerase-like protein
MKSRSIASIILFAFPLFALLSIPASAQEKIPALDEIKNQAELEKAITALDAQLFDAYNTCNLEKFESFLSDDVEFYHDQGGFTRGKATITESVKQNICGKVTRELVPGTLHVYSMKGYGAVEMGVHRFRHPGHDDTEPLGEASFVHLWQYKNGAWRIARIISYDHHVLEKK